MRVTRRELDGVLELHLDTHADERGAVTESWSLARYRAAGIDAEFVQDNAATTLRGGLRGLHYQLRAPQGKLVTVTRGEVFDVVVDLRRGTWIGTLLTPGIQLYIPPGYAHGFVARTDVADVSYKLTAPYAPSDARAIRWDDPDLAITWGIDAPILSARDAAAPFLRDAELAP